MGCSTSVRTNPLPTLPANLRICAQAGVYPLPTGDLPDGGYSNALAGEAIVGLLLSEDGLFVCANGIVLWYDEMYSSQEN